MSTIARGGNGEGFSVVRGRTLSAGQGRADSRVGDKLLDMSLGEYIGIGATVAITGGWIIVLVREFVAPWVIKQLRLRS